MKRANKRELTLTQFSLKEYYLNKSPAGCAQCLKEGLNNGYKEN